MLHCTMLHWLLLRLRSAIASRSSMGSWPHWYVRVHMVLQASGMCVSGGGFALQSGLDSGGSGFGCCGLGQLCSQTCNLSCSSAFCFVGLRRGGFCSARCSPWPHPIYDECEHYQDQQDFPQRKEGRDEEH